MRLCLLRPPRESWANLMKRDLFQPGRVAVVQIFRRLLYTE